MKKEKEVQRMCDGKLVCMGCNTTLAQAEKFGVTDENGLKFHNLRCNEKYKTQIAQRKNYVAGRATTLPTKARVNA